MKCSRRSFLLGSMGLIAAGCSSQTPMVLPRPNPIWPTIADRPRVQPPQVAAVAAQPAPQPVVHPAAGLSVLARNTWAQGAPVGDRLNPMSGINRVTVHHAGFLDIDFTDLTRTREHLESIRRYHVRERQWGDIGYHFIIDRAGRVWEGRPLAYQGAHVKNNNEHNIGVMVLGNFDRQRVAQAQLGTLTSVLVHLRRQFRVPVSRIYTHQEMNPTSCPGKHLQPWMVSMRHNGSLA